VVKGLAAEFPDISISKIRYLEDQKLLAPRRTPGGYRLYSAGDVSRLRTILRLQRDEFLPLRVIRQELAAGRTESEIAAPAATAPAQPARAGATIRRASFSIRESGALYSLDDVVEETGAERKLVAELEEYGIIAGQTRAGVRHYDETEREIVRAVAELARYGVAGRNLRVFRTSAGSGIPVAAADPRPGAPLPQPRAKARGGRGAREPRRRGVAPQAPAAGTRPAAGRQVSGPDLRALIRDIPDFPSPASRSRTSRRCCSIRRRSTPPCPASRAGRAIATCSSWWRPRRAASSSAPRLARELGAGFVPARKPGKLPHDTVSAEYILEYGVDALEMHRDAIAHGARVLIHDDLLATGGTARALAELVEMIGGHVVGCVFLVELEFLDGRSRLEGFDVHALVGYPGP
jgi:DNA-binding transcriptional MerR regulator